MGTCSFSQTHPNIRTHLHGKCTTPAFRQRSDAKHGPSNRFATWWDPVLECRRCSLTSLRSSCCLSSCILHLILLLPHILASPSKTPSDPPASFLSSCLLLFNSSFPLHSASFLSYCLLPLLLSDNPSPPSVSYLLHPAPLLLLQVQGEGVQLVPGAALGHRAQTLPLPRLWLQVPDRGRC